MAGAAAVAGGDAQQEPVDSRRGDIDGIVQPLAGAGEPDVVAGAGIGAGFDVDTFGTILAALIGGILIGIGEALAAEIEILGLDLSGHRAGEATVGGRGDANAGSLEFHPVEDKQILVAGISGKDEEQGMGAAGIGDRNGDVGIGTGGKRNGGGSEQRSRG